MYGKSAFVYPQINLKKTGMWLRILCKYRGITVKDLQDFLHISSNQAIYEWFNGHTLPSVNNLLALSTLLGISMNYLLVDDIHDVICLGDVEEKNDSRFKRCRRYLLLVDNSVTRM